MPTTRPSPRARPTWDTGLTVALLLALGAMLGSWALTPRGTVENDVGYYRAWSLWADANGGFSEVLREYPTPAALLVWVPTLVSSDEAGYRAAFATAMGLVAAVGVLALLWLPDRRGASRAGVVLLLTLGALGPITLYRFDIVPGVLLALAALALVRGQRGGWSAALALGTAVKLWPAAVWPLVLGRRAGRRRELLVASAASVVILVVAVAAGGWDRLLSPLSWQGRRGLQVESVAATWVLLARLVSPGTWTAGLSRANSWDFTGPGVAATLTVVSAAGVCLLAWVLVLTVRVWRRGSPTTPVVLASTSVVASVLVTDKVLSPQYLMWLAPVAALAIGACAPAVPRWWAPALVVAAGITQLSYPTTYAWLYPGSSDWRFLAGTLLMVARNLLLVALAVSASGRAWAASAPPGPTPGRHVAGIPGAGRDGAGIPAGDEGGTPEVAPDAAGTTEVAPDAAGTTEVAPGAAGTTDGSVPPGTDPHPRAAEGPQPPPRGRTP